MSLEYEATADFIKEGVGGVFEEFKGWFSDSDEQLDRRKSTFEELAFRY